MWSSGHVVIGSASRRADQPIRCNFFSSCWKPSLVGIVLAVGLGTIPALAEEAANRPVKAAARKAKAKPKKPPESAALAEAPPAPLLPYQLPAQAPTVNFQNGRLRIVADNSTLAAVLEQVRAATGAAVEASAFVGMERVTVRLGPAAPREVMADLLNGSSYNYVLLGSQRDPSVLERIIVTQRGAPVASSGAAPASVFPVRVQQPSQPQPEEEPETVPEVEEGPDETQPNPAETPPGSPQAAPQPGVQPGTVTQPGNQQPGQPPQVKTPQELLQELQERMRRHQEEQDQQRQQEKEEEEPK